MIAGTVGVLGLQGDVVEHRAALDSLGVTTTVVRRPRELESLAGLVIPGGESTTMQRLAEVFGLWGPLQSALSAGLPVLGTCAGMVLLAREIVDGVEGQRGLNTIDMVVRRNAFGRQLDSFESPVTVRGVDGEIPGVFIRAPWVEAVGEGVETLATVELAGGESKIVAVRQGRAMATSFHPEASTNHHVHRLFIDACVRQQ